MSNTEGVVITNVVRWIQMELSNLLQITAIIRTVTSVLVSVPYVIIPISINTVKLRHNTNFQPILQNYVINTNFIQYCKITS